MTKILHIGEYVQGGIATYIKSLIQHPRYGNIEEYLICSYDKSEHKWDLPEKHITYYHYRRNLVYIPYAIYAIHKYIRYLQPDIIYCHSTWAGLFARLPLFFINYNYRVVYNAHGWSFLRDTSFWKKTIYGFVEKMLSKVTDNIINVSKYEHNSALKHGLNNNKMRVIYSGISDEFGYINPEVVFCKEYINLLFVGRLDTQKGIDVLLEVYRKCKREDMYLHIIGDYVLENKKQIRISDNEHIILRGWIPHDELSSYYTQCDVVVVPSRWEAFGLVVIEAMKHGKAVIVSNKGALPELVENGVTGYVFDFDNQGTLNEILNKLDKETLKQMGRNAREKFQECFIQRRMQNETYTYLDVQLQER